jgi:periplasmic divalent cation tolerance protein
MRSSSRVFNRIMSDHLLVITTVPDAATAETLATRLVDRGLAACVNIGAPVTSIYRWEDGTQRDTELMLTIKTTRARYAGVEAAIADGHPYELPEIIAVPITDGLTGYLAWIEACTNR